MLKRLLGRIIGLLFLFGSVSAQNYNLSLRVIQFPDVVVEGHEYDLKFYLKNEATSTIDGAIGFDISYNGDTRTALKNNLGLDATINLPLVLNPGDSTSILLPNIPLDGSRMNGGGINGITIWPTAIGKTGTSTPAYKDVTYLDRAAFSITNADIVGLPGVINFYSSYVVQIRTNNIGPRDNSNPILFYVEVDNHITVISAESVVVHSGGSHRLSQASFNLSAIFPNLNISSGTLYPVRIWAAEDGQANQVSVADFRTQAGTLPVELNSFSGRFEEENAVSLSWVTTSEDGIEAFMLEKYSPLTQAYEQVGEEIEGGGISSMVRDYATKDVTPYAGVNSYRLLSRSSDGAIRITGDIVEVFYNVSDGFRVIYLAPNPCNTHAVMRIFSNQKDPIIVELFDAQGKLIYQTLTEEISGTHEIDIPTESLQSGVYSYRISNRDNVITGNIVRL